MREFDIRGALVQEQRTVKQRGMDLMGELETAREELQDPDAVFDTSHLMEIKKEMEKNNAILEEINNKMSYISGTQNLAPVTPGKE